jgi:hypothetical protein
MRAAAPGAGQIGCAVVHRDAASTSKGARPAHQRGAAPVVLTCDSALGARVELADVEVISAEPIPSTSLGARRCVITGTASWCRGRPDQNAELLAAGLVDRCASRSRRSSAAIRSGSSQRAARRSSGCRSSADLGRRIGVRPCPRGSQREPLSYRPRRVHRRRAAVPAA